jgi:hypothetical protein
MSESSPEASKVAEETVAEPEQRSRLFLERFIEKHFANQPAFVRAFVFILFSVLLAYSFYQGVGGEASVQGRLFIRQCEADVPPEAATGAKPSDVPKMDAIAGPCANRPWPTSRPAGDYNVVVGDKHFGVNWSGEYYLVLGRLRYLRLLTGRSMTITVYNRDASYHENYEVAFDVLGQSFRDLTFPPKATTPGESSAAHFLPFSFTAYAAPPPQENTQFLFLTSVKLADGNPRVKDGDWSLQVGNSRVPLVVADRVNGGSVALLSGQTIDLGRQYYFPVPMTPGQRVQGDITLAAKFGFFNLGTYTEHFTLQQAAEAFTLKGDRGSIITLSAALPVASSLPEIAKKAGAAVCDDAVSGATCHQKYPTGCSKSGKYDAYLNFLKNRIPEGAAKRVLGFTDFMKLEERTPLLVGHNAEQAELLASLGEGSVVSTIGYLYRALASGAESANCQLTGEENTDVTLHVGFTPLKHPGSASTADNQSTIVAEITPQYRAQKHPEWKLAQLRSLEGRQIKLVGQLMLDTEHANARDDCGAPNGKNVACWRASAWEIHPITDLFVCGKKTGTCDAASPEWERFH